MVRFYAYQRQGDQYIQILVTKGERWTETKVTGIAYGTQKAAELDMARLNCSTPSGNR